MGKYQIDKFFIHPFYCYLTKGSTSVQWTKVETSEKSLKTLFTPFKWDGVQERRGEWFERDRHWVFILSVYSRYNLMKKLSSTK